MHAHKYTPAHSLKSKPREMTTKGAMPIFAGQACQKQRTTNEDQNSCNPQGFMFHVYAEIRFSRLIISFLPVQLSNLQPDGPSQEFSP